MKKLKIWFLRFLSSLFSNKRGLLTGLIVFGAAASLLLRELVTLPGGMSIAENVYATTPIGWSGIWADPLYLPAKIILSIGFFWFDTGGALVSRLPSVFFGLLATIAVYYIMQVWHGRRIAVLTSVLFVANAWVLHVSRYASYDSSYLLAIPILIASVIALQRSKLSFIPHIVLFIWSVLLFTPGLIWLVLLAAFWQRYSFADAWTASKHWAPKVSLILAPLVLLPLLIFRLVGSSSFLMTWIGLPANFGSFSEFGSRLVMVPANIFVVGPDMPELWLGRLPLLDVITTIFVVLGVTYYARRWRASRAQLLAVLFIMSIVLIGLGGPISLSLIVPIVFLLAGAGIAQFYGDWAKRFPKNPIAKGFATVLIVLTVGVSVTNNVVNYFVAWPNAKATMSRFDAR